MLNPNVHAIDLKLSRAKHHLTRLYAAREAFIKGESSTILGHFDAERSEYVFRVTSPPSNDGFSIILGESVHHQRSALDWMIWQLILRRGNEPDDRTQFPIFDDEGKFRKSTAVNKIRRMVTDDDWTFIKSTQPYHAGTNPAGESLAQYAPLAVVGNLNNIDKHRFIHQRAAMIQMWLHSGDRVSPVISGRPRDFVAGTGFMEGATGPEVVRDISWSEPRSFDLASDDDPTEIARVRNVNATGPHPEMKMDPAPSIDIRFGDPHRKLWYVLWDLERAMLKIDEIFAHIKPLIS